MRTSNIAGFKMGWFIGDFEPTLLRTPAFEVAHHFYKKGFVSTPHTHKVGTEYNYIVTGSLVAKGGRKYYEHGGPFCIGASDSFDETHMDRKMAEGLTLGPGDIFIYEPFDVADVTFLEDTNLIIIKTPSLPGDKYEA